MDISSFEVGVNKMVTIHMVDMPKFGVRTENVTVYVGAAPIGRPQEVSSTNQTIVFSAASVAQSGKIGVIVMLPDGDQLDASSEEDYEYVPEVVVNTKPRVNGVNPQSSRALGRVTLRGSNLGNVKVISLTFNSNGRNLSYTVNQVQINSDGNSLGFMLPSDISTGAYLIGLGLLGGARIITRRIINVTD